MLVRTKYYNYFANSVKEALIFKLNFFLLFFQPFLFFYIKFSVWKYIFNSGFSNNSPLSFEKTILYSIVIQSIQFIFPLSIANNFSDDVRTGYFSIYQLRPVQYPLVLLAKYMALLILRSLFLAVPLVIGAIYYNLSTTAIFSLLTALPLSIICCAAMEFIFGALSFYIIKPQSIYTIVMTILGLLGGKILPIQYFPEPLRQIKYYNPLYAIYGVPADRMIGEISWAQSTMIQCSWCTVLILIATFIYRHGVSKYEASN